LPFGKSEIFFILGLDHDFRKSELICPGFRLRTLSYGGQVAKATPGAGRRVVFVEPALRPPIFWRQAFGPTFTEHGTSGALGMVKSCCCAAILLLCAAATFGK